MDKLEIKLKTTFYQIASVNKTRTGSDAILSSLKESKNSIISAAVPEIKYFCV